VAQEARAVKTASFTVRATEKQSLRWKRAAEAEGHAAVGTWLAEAANRFLNALQRAGKPLPLAWGKGRFRVRLEDGSEVTVPGWMARPFGLYHGTETGPLPHGAKHLYTLVYLPSARPVATFRTARHCKALASELARTWGALGRK
jgi:hypothetical protein